MSEILLVIHLMVAAALVITVLLQRSEGGGLGIGGGGMGNVLGARGTTNLLTRTTAILGASFFATSLALAFLSDSQPPRSIVEQVPVQSAPAVPATPTAPVSK